MSKDDNASPRMAAAPDAVIAGVLNRAAVGDRQAQRSLVTNAFTQFAAGGVSWSHCLHVAEAFCRLLAVHGDPDDRFALAAICVNIAEDLSDPCHHVSQPEYLAEAMAIFEELADSGHEQAGVAVQMMSDGLTPETMAFLKTEVPIIRIAGHGGEA